MRSLLLALLLVLPGAAVAQAPALDLGQPGTWPRAEAGEFGCAMERTLGVQDARFNCDFVDDEHVYDVCNGDPEYYAGPATPLELAKHLGVAAVTLDWEHRDLRAVLIELAEPLPEPELRTRLGLPPAGEALPENLMTVDIACEAGSQDACTRGYLQGFEHMGGADFDCPSD